MSDALQVVAESASVALHLDVSQLGHILVDDAVAVSEIDDVHDSLVLDKNSVFFDALLLFLFFLLTLPTQTTLFPTACLLFCLLNK